MNPAQLDPSKLAAARAAYQADLAANRPELLDAQGRSHAADPFDLNADGTVSFNRLTDAENRRSAQDTFFDDTETDAKGNVTTVRRPAWQQVPEYYNDESQDQFDTITASLKDLQNQGFKRMKKLFGRSMKSIG